MRRRLPPHALVALFAALLVAPGCSAKSASTHDESGSRRSNSIEVVDAAGVRHIFSRPVHRVISLVPSATLTLDALGARDVLVGRTDFDTASWTRQLPSVGGGIHPSVEAIVALHPDLVVLFAGKQDAQTPARLDQLGIAHLAVRPDRIEDVKTTIEILGRVTGHAERADSLVESMEQGLAAVRSSVAGLSRPRVAYVLGGTPPWVAGPGTYIDELITIAGGRNAFEDLGSLYAAVSPEELVARHLDVLLVPKATPFERSLVPGARVEVVSGALEIPGPDVVSAARNLAHLIHGDSLS
jgi:ABC-type Fe3+-hydroxamate transport system substrate-binding protein